jgi:hypothetical protein
MGILFKDPHPGRPYQQPQFEQRPRRNPHQGAIPRGPAPKQRVDANKGNDQAQAQNMEIKLNEEVVKVCNISCFNCAEWGHYSTNCKQPKLCFICHTSAHVGRDCPEWMKPLEPVQYLGSAA